ncbi:caldesmon isoform X2 [Anolis carolinensis]|uniref:caldesmon isoform X2 n=1 Tax=Anolis carolinensis TaxID=28377 RepID=UPI002F2B83CF
MPRRKSNLGRRTRRAQAKRRVIANQTEEERAAAKERHRQKIAQIRASETPERRAARLEEARLRAQRLRSAAANRLRYQKNKLKRLREAERRQQEAASRCKTRLRAQRSRPPLRWVVKEEGNGSATVLSENEWRLLPLHPPFSGSRSALVHPNNASPKIKLGSSYSPNANKAMCNVK